MSAALAQIATQATDAVTTALDALAKVTADAIGTDLPTARRHLARHLLFANRPLCPEAEQRAAMPDAEFWAHVAGEPQFDPGDLPGWEPFDDGPDVPRGIEPSCPECGADGACEFDAEGRALIHARSVR